MTSAVIATASAVIPVPVALIDEPLLPMPEAVAMACHRPCTSRWDRGAGTWLVVRSSNRMDTKHGPLAGFVCRGCQPVFSATSLRLAAFLFVSDRPSILANEKTRANPLNVSVLVRRVGAVRQASYAGRLLGAVIDHRAASSSA